MARYVRKNEGNEKREPRPPSLIAYHVIDGRKEGDKGFWQRIGAAWEHEDGAGLNLQLDLIPVSGGRIVLRVPADRPADEKPADEKPSESGDEPKAA